MPRRFPLLYELSDTELMQIGAEMVPEGLEVQPEKVRNVLAAYLKVRYPKRDPLVAKVTYPFLLQNRPPLTHKPRLVK
jgi:hypothetical protein